MHFIVPKQVSSDQNKDRVKSDKIIPFNVLFTQLGMTDNFERNLKQMCFNRGQKLFEIRLVVAIVKWCQQIEDRAVLAIIDPESRMHDQKRKALRVENLIK